jgi:hypothetical protein
VTLRKRPALLAVTAALAVAASGVGVGFAVAAAGNGDHTASQPPADSYGSLPSYLPKDTLKTDATVIGTVASPALTSQGDAVVAKLPTGRSVQVTVTGPETPGEGLPFQAQADTATWLVTMSHATGAVPVAVAAFSAIDSLGKVYQPHLVAGQPRPPASVRPGQTVHFELRVVMRVGEGDMRWAPMDNDLLATWDFVVEND